MGVAVRRAGVIGCLLATGFVAGAQSIPAPSQGSNGTAAGQGVATPTSPGAVPPGATAQVPNTRVTQAPLDDFKGLSATGLDVSIWQLKGLTVDKIDFEGVTFSERETLPI